MSLPARTDRLPGDWMGQDSTSSRAVVQQGAEDPGSPCAPQARPCVCPPQDTTLGSLSHPRTPQHWGGWRGNGISSTALLWHKELGPGPRLAQFSSKRGVSGSGVLAVGTPCCLLPVLLHLHRAQGKAKPALEPGRDLLQHHLGVSTSVWGQQGRGSFLAQPGDPQPGHAPCRSLTHSHVH